MPVIWDYLNPTGQKDKYRTTLSAVYSRDWGCQECKKVEAYWRGGAIQPKPWNNLAIMVWRWGVTLRP